MALLTRDEVLAHKGKLKTQEVPVPELGGSILLKQMSAADRDRFEIARMEEKEAEAGSNYANLRAKLVAATAVDEAGQFLFTPDDVEAIGGVCAVAIDRIFDAAMKLCGMSKEDVDKLSSKSEGRKGAGSSGSVSPDSGPPAIPTSS